jgi:beta-glucosidase
MNGRTYRYYEGEAVFPFGHGLSYTTFDIGKPAYSNNRVQVRVKNTGSHEGTETLQVYIHRPADKEDALKTLRAYQQIQLKPGEQRTVTIPLTRQQFETWDAKTNTMRVVAGKYEVMVGNSSADNALQKITVNIK